MENKIKVLKDKLSNATSDGMRVGFMAAIKEAETELRMMQLRTAGTPLLVGGDISKPTGRSVKSDLDAGEYRS